MTNHKVPFKKYRLTANEQKTAIHNKGFRLRILPSHSGYDSEDLSDRFLENVDIYVQEHTAPTPRKRLS